MMLSCLLALVAAVELPVGSAPSALSFPHFPDALHTYVFRNWDLVPVEDLARVVGAQPAEITALGTAMGLQTPAAITADFKKRSYITVIRRNWHLLPYEQLLDLLKWTPEELAYTLREDDFLYVKLGLLKPNCPPIQYAPPSEAATKRAAEIAAFLQEHRPKVAQTEPLFQFVQDLSAPYDGPANNTGGGFSPRYCSSYFALYGDPLLEGTESSYPDGYLARLAASGVDGVWLQGVLYKLFPFPWKPELSAGYEQRLKNLADLVARARKHGIGVYLYLNEPRAMPNGFYDAHADLKGVVEGDHSAMCTSAPEVQEYLRAAVAGVSEAVPDLAGYFTITASENLTNCWSHHNGQGCARCSKRTAAEVIAEVNTLITEGIARTQSGARLTAWDWGWQDEWAPAAIAALPASVALQSVSEWSLPVTRGGVSTAVGEYSISAIGPGPRATRHWQIARDRGLKTIAKIQAGNTWELSAVPYIPALNNVAQHAANLRGAGVDGLMLGWTLGGYPSPNLEVVAALGGNKELSPENALQQVAENRFGVDTAPAVVQAWQQMSTAFSEFPYHGGLVYSAPLQMGPANLLWAEPTGYKATMVGIPYDDLDAWRQVYPAEVFVQQFRKIQAGFEGAIASVEKSSGPKDPAQQEHFQQELSVWRAAALHFGSVADQAEFTMLRGAADAAGKERLRALLGVELERALKLYALQLQDSRIGYEATNHYFYTPADLLEKALNCQHLLAALQ